MSENNVVYKGYKLSARVSRVSAGGSGRPAFTATISVEEVASHADSSERHDVPFFHSGGFVSHPGMAVRAAIDYGRSMVDAHSIGR